MLPPAPGLFSTTTCWPHISESRAPTMRPIESMPPPGVNGTTRRTKRVGQACANAGRSARLGASTHAAETPITRRRVSMYLLSPWRHGNWRGYGCDKSVNGPRVFRRISSIDQYAGLLDDHTPFVDFRIEQSREPFGRRADHHIAALLQLPFARRVGERRNGVGIHLPDDLTRCLGRHEQAVPRRHFVAREAGLGDGRQFRRRRISFRTGHRKGADLARPHVLEQRAAAEI